MRAVAWTIDILVGWLVGSIIVGSAFGVIGWLVSDNPDDWMVASQAGAVLGTVLGIVIMRVRRRRRTANEPSGATFAATRAAGWYADPWEEAARRYYDGAKWTAHVSSEGDSADEEIQEAGQPSVDRSHEDDIEVRLARLAQLREQETISVDEYNELRAEILREI